MFQNRTRVLWAGVPLLAALFAITAIIAASAQANTPLEDPIPGSIEQGSLTITLEPIAEGLTAPNEGAFAPGCESLASWLFVGDQDGILWAIDTATGSRHAALDVSSLLVPLGAFGPGTFDERGFVGFAFHPQYASNGLLYTYTSEPTAGPADFSTMPPATAPNHQSVVREWVNPDPCDAESVFGSGSSREILRVDEPQFNHNAGAMHFGPDGNLYVAFGDGGNRDDEGVGHVEGGNGQEPGNILGTIIRIDPAGTDSANGQYGIPADNPFVGTPGHLAEVYAYGFRNPFRFSFDSETGEMYIGDVGQGFIEEIDLGVAGGNYGWRLKEGSFCFDPAGADPGFVFDCGAAEPAGLIDPIAEYDHDEGIAVVGGYVYRGDAIPPLKGRYVFGDFLLPAIDSGRLFYLQQNNEILEFQIAGSETLGLRLLGFGQDAAGELYVLANQAGVPFGETGVVLKIGWANGKPAKFDARLSGGEEVPPVETRARGQAKVGFDAAVTAMDFRVVVTQADGIVAAHVHCAPDGQNGPVGVTLFMGGPTSSNGVLAEGSATAPDPGNGCGWTSLFDVRAAMESGNAYVNVHTQAHPGGEIRGQLD